MVTNRSRLFYGWWVLLSAATVLMVAFSMASYALPVFYPELVRTFHWPRASVALGGSMKTLLIGVVAPVNGWIIDRKGVKHMLIAGVLTLAVSYALLSTLSSLGQFFLLCFCIGVGGSWTHHVPTQLLVGHWFQKRRGLTIGMLMSTGGLGDTLMPLLSNHFIKGFGWREAALLLPLILIVPLVAVVFVARNRPQEMGLNPDGDVEPSAPSASPSHAFHSHAPSPAFPQPSLESDPISAFRSPKFWMLAGLLLLIGWSSFSVWQHLVLYLRDQGFSPTRAAALFSLFLGASTVSRFVGGPLSDRISAVNTIFLSLGLNAAAYGLLLLPVTSQSTFAAMTLFGLGYGGTLTCRPLIVFEFWGSTGVGKVYGAVTALFTLGAFAGPALAGHIYDRTHSYGLAFILALVLTSAACLVLLLLKAANPRDRLRSGAGSHSLRAAP